MKRAMLLACGLSSFLIALMIGVCLFRYWANGLGVPIDGFTVSPLHVFIGLIQLLGLLIALALSFAVGAGLCAYGLHGHKGKL
jgi:hypothetical protein